MYRQLTLDDTQREALLELLDEWGEDASACAFLQELFDTGKWDGDEHNPPSGCRWAAHKVCGGYETCYGCWWLRTIAGGGGTHQCRRFGCRNITGPSKGKYQLPEPLFPDCRESFEALKAREEREASEQEKRELGEIH